VTPPENGVHFEKKLTKSQLFVLDEGGHSGVDLDCKMRVMIQFMDNTATKINSSCLKIYQKG